jgi:hypothetical protein
MGSDRQRIRLPEPGGMAFQLAAGRTATGAVVLALPVLSARLLGTDSATAKRVTWLTRMMAVRDAAIGAGGLATARAGSSQTPWLVAGAVCDAVDAIVLTQALRQGRVKGVTAAAVVPLAAGAAAVGALTAIRLRRAG